MEHAYSNAPHGALGGSVRCPAVSHSRFHANKIADRRIRGGHFEIQPRRFGGAYAAHVDAAPTSAQFGCRKVFDGDVESAALRGWEEFYLTVSSTRNPSLLARPKQDRPNLMSAVDLVPISRKQHNVGRKLMETLIARTQSVTR